MIINNICSPAIIYLGFSLTQIIIDIYKSMYNTAFLKFIVSIIFTIILNILCERNLHIISWIIVFIPFIFMTVITTILLYMFGLDPFFGKLKYDVQTYDDDNNLVYDESNIKNFDPRNLNYESNEELLEQQENTNNILNNRNFNLQNENTSNKYLLNNMPECKNQCVSVCNSKNTSNNPNYCKYTCDNVCEKLIYS
jgi:hypothetical protein